MSTSTTEHDAATHAEGHDHPTDMTFIKVAVILAIITALETSTYWWPSSVHTLSMAVLLILMTVKFFMILLWFMHLKWDSKLFSLMFYIGLVLAIGCYMVALLTFHFFG
jgi:cytochrome c oxidase subunit 4